MNKSVSIIIPAYNEEKKLEPTVKFTLETLNRHNIIDFEIIIFDDASTDKTDEVADELARNYPKVRVVHNERNMNLGFNFVRGIQLATKEFVGMVPGDNEMEPESLDNIFNALGKADIIIPYIENPKARPWGRRFLSKTYVLIINTAFNLNLKYYNGGCYFKTSMVKKVPVSTYGFSYMTEILVKVLKSYPSVKISAYPQSDYSIKLASYASPLASSALSLIEVPMINRVRERGATKAFRIKNIASVFKTFLILFWEIQILKRRIRL